MIRPPLRSTGRRRYAVLRPRDSQGRFLPVDAESPYHPRPLPTPNAPPTSSTTSRPPPLLQEFRDHVNDAWPQLCRSVIAQAIEGNRWALEHVFQYTIGDWRLHIVEPDQESRLHRYLAEIAHAMRTPDDETPDNGPANDPYSHPHSDPPADPDNGNPYDRAP